MKVLLITLLAAGLLFLSGCAGADAELGTLTLASGLDDNGQPSGEMAALHPGDTVYLAVEFTTGYDGLESKVTWYRGETELQTETLRLDRAADKLDPLWVSAALQTRLDWPVGSYRCEVLIPDQGTTRLDFQLQ